MVTLIHRPEYGQYDFGPEHPFTPSRLAMLLDLMRELGVPPNLVAAPSATREEILSVHAQDFVELVEALDRGESRPDAEAFGLGTPDNPVFRGMDQAARWLVGGTLHGARLLLEGHATQVLQLGGGLHHAQANRAAGFCLYNDLAVAIQAMVDQGWNVAYLDIDLHHGDGVQNIFYGNDRVLTISLHESGHYLYPGTGHIHEMGNGHARGMAVNVPLEPFTEGEGYLDAFDEVVPDILASFPAMALVVQAGADAHFADPLGDLALTTQNFQALYQRIIKLAADHAQGRLLVTLGGGYEAQAVARVWAILALTLLGLPLPERLPEDWVNRWRHLLGEEPPLTLQDLVPAFPAIPGAEKRARHNRDTVSRLIDSRARFSF
jgi:acetoin utilization protein AcuC